MPGQILNKKFSSVSNLILMLAALSFFLFYLVLSYYNRPASDDILFIDLFRQKGPVEFVKYIYNNWSGRWAPAIYFSFLLNLSHSFQGIHIYMFLYYCLTLVLFIYSANSILRFVAKTIFKSSVHLFTSLTFSILFMAGFYFFTFQHIEAWWWFCASFAYLQGVVFLLFGTVLILKENKNLLHFILIALSFMASCSEIFALIVLSFFVCLFFYKLRVSGGFSVLKNNSFFKACVIAFISLFFSAVICFIAPGNLNRLNKEIPPANNSVSTAKNTNNLLIKNILSQKKYPVAIAISSLFLLLGMKLKINAKEVLELWRLKKLLIFTGALLFISIAVAFSFQFFILKHPLPLRTWTFTGFCLATFCCAAFIVIGYYLKSETFFSIYIVKLLIPGFVFAALTYNLYKQYNYTSEYARAYDGLIVLLQEKKKSGNKDTLFVNKLPDSGMLVNLNIEDKNISAGLKNILELDYEIEVRE